MTKPRFPAPNYDPLKQLSSRVLLELVGHRVVLPTPTGSIRYFYDYRISISYSISTNGLTNCYRNYNINYFSFVWFYIYLWFFFQEKSAAMHSPINKRINGGSHHPYNNMHHNSRNIMNGLATSSSSSLSVQRKQKKNRRNDR